MATAEQLKRMNDINELVKLIASIDHRTFYRKSKDRIAYFRFKKKLFFVDDYTGDDVYPYEMGYGSPNGFSHGGNMWQLVNSNPIEKVQPFRSEAGHIQGNRQYILRCKRTELYRLGQFSENIY